MLTCEACNRPGVYRDDYDAVLCDTHAELPSYALPYACRPDFPWAGIGVWVFALAVLITPFAAAWLAFR